MSLNWVKSRRCDSSACVEAAWTKSTFSGNQGSCVETIQHLGVVCVRDSKDPDGPYLTFTREEWTAFIAGANAGEFDL